MKRTLFLLLLLFFIFSGCAYAVDGIKLYNAGDFCFAYDNGLFSLKTKDNNIILKTLDLFSSKGKIESPWVIVINPKAVDMEGTNYIDADGAVKKDLAEKLILGMAKKDNPLSPVDILRKSYFNDKTEVFISSFAYKFEEEERQKINYFIFKNNKLYYVVGFSGSKDCSAAKVYFEDIIKSFSFN